MDGNGKKPPAGGKKAARATPPTEAATPTQQPAERAALETSPVLSGNNAATAAQQIDVGQADVASVDESRGGGGAEEVEDNRDDDDEQVERFYALLANIRAMRSLVPLNMVSSSSFGGGRGDSDGTDTADDTGAGDSAARTKRLRRSAEPPWRPVFRMEDFETAPPPAASSTTCKRTRGAAGRHDDRNGHGESSGSARSTTSVAVVASSSMPHAAVRFQQSDSRTCSRD